MINFEEELKRFRRIPEVNQAEDAIYMNDLKDISDIVTQMTENMYNMQGSSNGQITGRIRR